MDVLLSGNWAHYIIVDRPHFDMFKHLQSQRRHVLVTEDVLPGNMRLLFHMPFVGGRSLWWSKSAGLSIGWHLQQMVKIGIASKLNEDGLAYCDSDTFFLKPFDVASLTRDNKFRLYRNLVASEPSLAPNPSYTRAALEMLGLPLEGKYHAYVDNFVTWRRKSVLELQEHLGRKYNGEWRRAFRNRIKVSEYNLYGLYVDNLVIEETDHFRTSQLHCKTKWHRESMTEEQIQRFCEALEPQQVMVGIQSFAGVDVGLLEQQFEATLKARRFT